jgi:cytochrome c oxidase assembly factor CtaG
MSVRTVLLGWSLDGPLSLAFLILVAASAEVYVLATVVGRRRDRRGRRWPLTRTLCFLGGLVVLVVDLYSGIGTEADSRLAAHMVEHMVMWLVAAPLLAAGAPVRLALFALPRAGRKVLVRWLHSPPAHALTGPVGSISLFSAVLVLTHVPAVYGLTLSNDYAHEAEHGVYLICAVLMWAPLLGADPLPNRPTPRGQLACMGACMLPMAAIAVWLATAPGVVYGHYVATLGAEALNDQRLAGAVMVIGGLPAFAPPALTRIRQLGPTQNERRAPAAQG